MSPQTPQRRVIALAPMPPEKSAYALARYSRSPDSIEQSLQWVHAHSSERFWEQFYFEYGHASIADLGHLTICFENITERAAIDVEDEPLWDGQAKSSRYQDFSAGVRFVPGDVRGTEAEGTFHGVADRLASAYERLYQPVWDCLTEHSPRPETMQPAAYTRAMKARTLDVTRYLLPLASLTNVGQVVSIRTLEKQVSRFLSSGLPEMVQIGEELLATCQTAPLGVWNEMAGFGDASPGPLAPTLARHAKAQRYRAETIRDLTQLARERLLDDHVESAEPVDLLDPHHPLDEIVTTLLYSVSHFPYRQLLKTVRSWNEKDKREVIEVGMRRRGPHDDLLREFHSGYTLVFDLLMDIGGWRDLHRHRRCQQIRQDFTTRHGYECSSVFDEAGLTADVRRTLDSVFASIDALRDVPESARAYLLPFASRVRCLFKMDYAEAEYISRLRSGVKGHPSYRRIAWLMKERITERYPFLGEHIRATPPDAQDALTR